MNLRLGHGLDVLRATWHNGPGWRIGIWVQGCVHRCTAHCLSPHMLDPTGGLEFPVEAVLEAVRRTAAASSDPVEGVTILGGEPFEQAGPLAALVAPLRRDGLSAMIYSGHTLEGLRRMQDPGIDALLDEADILVDGPFLPDFADGRAAWRGSTNQRILRLSGRYSAADLDAAFARQGKGFSIRVGGGRVSISGLQTPEGADEVAVALGLPDRSGQADDPHAKR